MPTPTKSSAYVIISNNPQLYYPWAKDFDYSTATKDDFLNLMKESVEAYVNPSNHKGRDSSINGVMVVCELSPSGTFHMHHVVCAKNKVKYDSVQGIFNHSNIQKAYGSAEQNRNYIFKTGNEKNAAKAETQLCEPYIWGEWFGTDSDQKQAQGKIPVYAQVEALLDDGLYPDEIFAISPLYASHAQMVETAFAARHNIEIPPVREKTIYYHFGESRSGKSETLLVYQKKNPTVQVCKLDSGANMFDEYQFEDVVFLDEVKGSHVYPQDITLNIMLRMLDKHKCTLPCRYRNKAWNPSEVHITSIYPPEKLYSFGRDETKEQLILRCTYIVYHWKVEQSDGSFKYYEYSIPSGKYVDADSLEFEAKQDGGREVIY